MNVNIKIIPHSEQRYDTVGDWFFDENSDLQIRVSKLPLPVEEQLVAVHEYCEALMCLNDGVTQKQVDDFDMAFEQNRPQGSQDEPGDSIQAPYYKQHGIASGIERILSTAQGVDWNEYANHVEAL